MTRGNFPDQNPTSLGVAGHKRRIVQQDESLDFIAFSEYGDARYWRHIADANSLNDPMRVRAGTVLQLPPLQEG